ncbi:hypothetical protein P3342_004220 [Pyrenophora teres f. teres]|nr:hypothetical protein P3342_004220 [Pyrenophora teres f. teres]
MPRQQHTQQTSREGRIRLAIADYQNNPQKSVRALAVAYDVPRSTLQTRLHGTQPRSEIVSVNRKLLATEEHSLVDWILDLDRRGFPPQVIDVRRMTDALLAARGQDPPPLPVGKKWVSRFVNSQPKLQTKWDRKLHSQRALCGDPVAIAAWFKLVEETRQAYGILDTDTYNFDETGFMIGVAATSKVVTSVDTVGRATVIQPGNRDWVTTIECINASGWCLPPLVILSGKQHQASWYHHLPTDWVVAVSDNGWTTDQLGVEWMAIAATPRQSLTSTVQRTRSSLCMPAHTSHLLQPLDVSCFAPLKRAYGHEIQELARQGVYHVDKIDFLQVYTQIQPTVFTQQNIQAAFQATGLIPLCPDRVLSSLTVVRTPSPPGTTADNNAAWTAGTPRTVAQLQQQAKHLQDRLRRQSQSPTNQLLRQVVKSCQVAMQSATILAEENKKLRAASQRQQRKQDQRRQYIARGGALQAQQGQQLALEAERVAAEVEQALATPGRQRAPPTCSKCHVQGHTRTQCR